VGIIKKEKPNIVFSKGGFVAVPVVLAAFLNRVPVVAHESDITPGLANRISLPYCSKICVTFPEALEGIKKGKGILTGSPIRKELFYGNKSTGRNICSFSGAKPVILIIGGSLGSVIINKTIRENLDKLLSTYDIVHLCGKGNVDKNLLNKKGYVQFEYLGKELSHVMAAADLVISRAGANSIFEFLALKKPNLLIPLSKRSSRGDQILNAESFQKSGYSLVIQEEELNINTLWGKLEQLRKEKQKFISNMENSPISNGTEKVIEVIKANTKSI
jgi:UDP-N-acetylglucosamine--N-acetylmuramyl-(pentapeptide) pyrophosphoryl-undecaprenol N-acetylglucosamine transferase